MTDHQANHSHGRTRFVTDALTRVCTTVAVAQGMAASGRRIDLHGLDSAAGVLCAQVLDLPPDEALSLLPALDDLQTRLSTLTSTLAGQVS